MFLLTCVVLSWSVLGMVVMNHGDYVDPYFPSLDQAMWNMLMVLNTANWPNPIIPSYNQSTGYFLFFLMYVNIADICGVLFFGRL